MESLDSKLCRLSEEQQREVEDFVDFLLERRDKKPVPPAPLPAAAAPVAVAPPALTAQEPGRETISVRIDDVLAGQKAPRPRHEEDPATQLIQEIALEKEEIFTADYMDYGAFDPAPVPPPSPATDAVQRVKARLSGKNKTDPAKNLLDWIE